MKIRTKWIVFSAGAAFLALTTFVQRTFQPQSAHAQVSVQEKNAGVLAGGGMLYRLGRVELRGGLRFWGDARDVDLAAQVRF